ncbi:MULTISPECIES: DUF2398 family protein [Actinotignum]|uniref:DUF2398 family protein n=1 Tax=Actinotignum TaxID=1653174 RepID=UPI00254AF7D0|nr:MULTISPECIES: DUF2398 family protein [Actinotignum]MDE1536131.1 DUF2398 family protein [Actinotignum schaalii]MDK7270936.1 DUF2398 family protein [Actinotignum schaalii]MDY5130536.1 DUF2398 family protein [Actinotignum timonense]MDY5150013.1 DUF2398 family protein [Actinotignum timonense]
MSVTMFSSDRAEKQLAFIGLLCSPVVAPWTNPELTELVRRHLKDLEMWCERLGYRIGHVGECYRLRRTPLDGKNSVPVGAHPDRGQLLLRLYAAASLEDQQGDSITLQELSDQVRNSSASRNGWPYDPDTFAHRRRFIAAVQWLCDQGVLSRLTDEIRLDTWAREGSGFGAGYRIHRDCLMMLINVDDVDLGLSPVEETDTRRKVIMRALIEQQALYPEQLTDEERAYLYGPQRGRIAALVEEMTGGIVEIRSDVALLSLPQDRNFPGAVHVLFPSSTALDWACLAFIDRLAPGAEGSWRRVSRADIERVAADIHATFGAKLTKELQESPRVLAEKAEERLRETGLLEAGPEGWSLSPLAARYRGADLEEDAVVDESLF